MLVEPDDVYGDGVNIAARLQTAVTPADVNISGGVYEQVKNKLVCGYQSLGDEKLKNITDPVRIYRVLPDPAAVRGRKPLRRALRIGVPAAGGARAWPLAVVSGSQIASTLNTARLQAAADDTPYCASPASANVLLRRHRPSRVRALTRCRACHRFRRSSSIVTASARSRAAGGLPPAGPRVAALPPPVKPDTNLRGVVLPRLPTLS